MAKRNWTGLKRAILKIGMPGAILGTALVVTGLPARAPVPPVALAAPTPLPLKPAQAPVEQSYVIKSALQIDGPLKHGTFVWNDDGVPQGPILVTVDLKAQTLSIFRAGYEIGVAVILYGADDKPTPLGAFPVIQKKKDHVSNLYDAPMPYMLRLTNDGVAVHGSTVEWGGATHGCIGIPVEFAKLLFEQVKLGDRVIITNGQMLAVGDQLPAA